MGVNVLTRTFLHARPNDLKIPNSLLSACRHTFSLWAFQQSHTGQSTIGHALQGSFHFFVFNCLVEKCDLDCVFSAQWRLGRLNRMTIARSEEEDKSRSAFTHILDSDSSTRPLSFIIPLLCLKLYGEGWAVPHLRFISRHSGR